MRKQQAESVVAVRLVAGKTRVTHQHEILERRGRNLSPKIPTEATVLTPCCHVGQNRVSTNIRTEHTVIVRGARHGILQSLVGWILIPIQLDIRKNRIQNHFSRSIGVEGEFLLGFETRVQEQAT